MLLWATLLNCALSMAAAVRAGLKEHWGGFAQYTLLAALAWLAQQHHSEFGLLATFILTLALDPTRAYFRRRTLNWTVARDFQRARRWNRFTRLLMWGPEGKQWQHVIELNCRHLEGDAAASAALERLAEFPPGTAGAMAAFSKCLAERDWNRAAELYAGLPQRAGLPGATHVAGARVLLREGRFAEAADAMERAVTSSGRSSRSFIAEQALVAAALLGRVQELQFWLTLDGGPKWRPELALHAQGLALARAQRPDEARRAFEAARQGASEPLQAIIEADLATLDTRWEVPLEPTQRILRCFRQLYLLSALSQLRLGKLGALLLAAVLVCYVLQPVAWSATGYLSLELLASGEWWRLITYQFTHANLAHLLLNALGLAVTAPWVELLFGRRIVLLYFAAGVLSGAAHLALHPDMLLIGASGAVFGLYGACAAALLRLTLLPPLRRRKRLQLMGCALLFQVIADQLIPHIASAAHIGGFFAGFAGGLILPWSQHTPLGQVLRLDDQPVEDKRGGEN